MLVHLWISKTERLLEARGASVADAQMVWMEDFGKEYPHDIQDAINDFNQRMTKDAQLTLNVRADGGGASIVCRAVIRIPEPPLLSEHTAIDIYGGDDTTDGNIRCDNCAVVLMDEQSCIARWNCSCAYVCSDACRLVVRHRTGDCDCRDLSACMATVRAWSRAHPTSLLNSKPSVDCSCDGEDSQSKSSSDEDNQA